MGSEANEFLMSGGLPAVPFNNVGDAVTMVIAGDAQKVQVTDPNTGEVKKFQSGDIIYMVLVPVSTSLRDATIDQDDGTRMLWIKNRMLQAVRDAVRRAGAPGLEIGGQLTVQFVSQDEPKSRTMSGTKNYSAHYVPPVSAGNDALMAGAPAPAPQPAVPAPAYQPPTPAPVVPAAATTAGQPVTYGGAPVAPQIGVAPVSPGVAVGLNPQPLPPQPAPVNGTPPPGVAPEAWAAMPDEVKQKVLAAYGNTPGY